MCELRGFIIPCFCTNVADCPVVVFWSSHQRQTFHQDLTVGFCGTSKFHVLLWRLEQSRLCYAEKDIILILGVTFVIILLYIP